MSQTAARLFYDIETSPLITYSWQIWQADAIKVIKDTQILCFAYKWAGEKGVKVIGQNDFKGYSPGINNDNNVVEALRGLFDLADIVIAHNGNSFDQKVVQSRMMVHGFSPPSPYKQIDTKLVAKRYARFTSNKLDDLGKSLQLGQKLSTGGFALWEGCLAGDKKSWSKMKRYNKQDVILLEQLYNHLLPWIDNHPPMNLLTERPDACPKCGVGPLHNKGKQVSKTNTYQRWQCQNCGGYCRSRVADKREKVDFVN